MCYANFEGLKNLSLMDKVVCCMGKGFDDLKFKVGGVVSTKYSRVTKRHI